MYISLTGVFTSYLDWLFFVYFTFIFFIGCRLVFFSEKILRTFLYFVSTIREILTFTIILDLLAKTFFSYHFFSISLYCFHTAISFFLAFITSLTFMTICSVHHSLTASSRWAKSYCSLLCCLFMSSSWYHQALTLREIGKIM